MADLGVLIETPRGLGTVVEIRPGRIEPSLSQVVAEAIDGGRGVPSALHWNTPLPGQAQSAASFIQMLILPSEGQPAPDPLPVSQDTATTAYQATQQRTGDATGQKTLLLG